MKPQIYLMLLCFIGSFGYGQTTLVPGDIAITGFNSDDLILDSGWDGLTYVLTEVVSEFTFVLLRDIESGTSIRFTDNGWTSSDTFRTGEGTLIWTANSNLDCGTVITIRKGATERLFLAIFSSGIVYFYSTSEGSLNSSSAANFDLGGTSGDQILVYQGTEASPNFVFAINFNGGSGFWQNNSTGTNSSRIPAGLTNGVNAVPIAAVDNAKYNCAETSGSSLILDGITYISGYSRNWNRSNSRYSSLNDCTYSCGDCGIRTVWNGTSWNNGTPDLSNEVRIRGDYNTNTHGSFQACYLLITNGAELTVANGDYIEVENDVLIRNGDLIVETQGNFVQNADSGTFNVNNNGASQVNKTTAEKDKWYYYSYWSSPVIGQTIGGVFPGVPSDYRYEFRAANFADNTGDDIDDNNNDWQQLVDGTVMAPGVGYAVASNMTGTFPRTDNMIFNGDFNTGDIDVTITYNGSNTGVRWNFIGNPYPSAIDFESFYAANSAIIEGAAYFWSQAAPPSALNPGNGVENFSQNDYAILNVGSGSVAASSGGSGTTPNGYVASGQGFFVPALSTLSGVGTVTFTNGMRMTSATSNSQFFKTSNSKTKHSVVANKLWVDLTTDSGVFNQILVAYVEDATDANDGMFFDAPRFLTSGYHAAFYSIIVGDAAKYAIQGKEIHSLDDDEIIPLGFVTSITAPTTFKLSLSKTQGDYLSNRAVYLKDKLESTIHDLTASDYTFTSQEGEFNDRFEIVFTPATLSNDDYKITENTIRVIQLSDDVVQFSTSGDSTIKRVRIFDVSGRHLYHFSGSSASETYVLPQLKNTVYIAKIELANGAILTKKVIMR